MWVWMYYTECTYHGLGTNAMCFVLFLIHYLLKASLFSYPMHIWSGVTRRESMRKESVFAYLFSQHCHEETGVIHAVCSVLPTPVPPELKLLASSINLSWNLKTHYNFHDSNTSIKLRLEKTRQTCLRERHILSYMVTFLFASFELHLRCQRGRTFKMSAWPCDAYEDNVRYEYRIPEVTSPHHKGIAWSVSRSHSVAIPDLLLSLKIPYSSPDKVWR